MGQTNMSYVHGSNKQQICHMCMGRTNNKCVICAWVKQTTNKHVICAWVKQTTNMSYVHGLNKQRTCHMCMGRTNNKHARKYKTCIVSSSIADMVFWPILPHKTCHASPPLPNSLEVQGRALPLALPMHLKKHRNVLKMFQQLCCCGFQMAHLTPISKNNNKLIKLN